MTIEKMKEVFWLVQDYRKKGWTITAIAEELNISWPTAKKYCEKVPEKQTRPKRGSKLDPYKDYIQMRIQEGTTNCEVLLEEIRARGYTGGKTILKDYVQPFRKAPQKQAIPRYETQPSEQAQVDWMDCGIRVIDGKKKRVYGFLMTLGYSRKKYLHFVVNMKMDTFLRCMRQAFEYFGGVPKRVLFDNMKTVVQKRLKNKLSSLLYLRTLLSIMGFKWISVSPENPERKAR